LINWILLKNQVLQLSLSPEYFVDLLKAFRSIASFDRFDDHLDKNFRINDFFGLFSKIREERVFSEKELKDKDAIPQRKVCRGRLKRPS
jgi:hypothetical protein